MKSHHVKSLARAWATAIAVLLIGSCGGDGANRITGSAGTSGGTLTAATVETTGTTGTTGATSGADPAGTVATSDATLPSGAFVTTLTGPEEVPPTPSSAIGSGVVVVDAATG